MTVFMEAKYVYTRCDDDEVVVGFADDQFATSEYILLQREHQQLQEGNCLPKGDVYVEINDQRFGTYGGVKSIALSASVVAISFEPRTADRLRTEERIEVSISEADPDFTKLQEALESICGDAVAFAVSL